MKQEHENTESVPEVVAMPKPSALNDNTTDSLPPMDDGFHPIEIIGEPLSVTIIRERRERPW